MPRLLRATSTYLPLAAALLLTPAAARGQASPSAPAAPKKAEAPTATLPAPVIDAITCRTECQAIDGAIPGSTAVVSGQNMAAVNRVVLLGRRGKADDKVVAALGASPTVAVFIVPAGAHTGPVRALAHAAHSEKSRRRLLVGRAGAPLRRGALLQARSDVRRAFAGAVAPSVSFFLRSAQPLDVAVDLIRAADGVSVGRWNLAGVAPGSVQNIVWSQDSANAAEGRYLWRVLPASEAAPATASAGGAYAATSTPSAPRMPAFALVRHVFPIQGKHAYGMSAGRFGTGRAGHSHQGQDVFADCGTPLVAVTAGTIKYSGFDGNGGNYLVLAGEDGFDYAFMHLKDKVTLKKGDAISTGQSVGRVGDTGDAVGCHLHFEIWPAPGWYTGGSPVDPLPYLKSWDV